MFNKDVLTKLRTKICPVKKMALLKTLRKDSSLAQHLFLPAAVHAQEAKLVLKEVLIFLCYKKFIC